MGNARWSDADWQQHSQSAQQQTRQQIFKQAGMVEALDPAKIKFREAVASASNPNPTPIILAADQTGSMGILAEQIIKHDLGVIMKELYDRKPVSDPQICCMAIGDANSDTAPLQVTQFEASVAPLTEQVAQLWLEAQGGGNGGESYPLVWAFAVGKTKCDAIRKRKRKGYIFTIGDECPHPITRREHLQQFLGLPAEADARTEAMLALAQKDWHIFHLIVKPVSDQPVLDTWRGLLGERAILVPDHERLAAGIVAIIQTIEGTDAANVHKGWNDDALITVRSVTKQLQIPAEA